MRDFTGGNVQAEVHNHAILPKMRCKIVQRSNVQRKSHGHHSRGAQQAGKCLPLQLSHVGCVFTARLSYSGTSLTAR